MKGLNKKTGTVYTKANVQAAFDEYVARLAPYRPAEPLKGPVSVGIVFCYKAKKPTEEGVYKITKPDCDNMAKLLLDAVTRCGFYEDDARIAALYIEKRYAAEPGVYLEIANLPIKRKEN